MPQKQPRVTLTPHDVLQHHQKANTLFDAISIGEGFVGRYGKNVFYGKPESRRIALIDPLYAHPTARPLIEKALARGVAILPQKLAPAIRELKKRGLKTQRITIDMPGASSPSELKIPNHTLYNFEALFREAHHILVPNGRIFVVSEDPELMLTLVDYAQKYGLKVAGWHPYTKATPRAKTKSEWIGKALTLGHRLSRGVFVLPLTKTHTKEERRALTTKNK